MRQNWYFVLVLQFVLVLHFLLLLQFVLVLQSVLVLQFVLVVQFVLVLQFVSIFRFWYFREKVTDDLIEDFFTYATIFVTNVTINTLVCKMTSLCCSCGTVPVYRGRTGG